MIKVLAGLSLAFGGYIAGMNWYSIYASHKAGRNVSSIPLVGAWFIVLGLCGFQQTKPYAWAGILVDYGTLTLMLAIPSLARESWTISRIKLLHRFLSVSNGRRDDIRLFKRGKFTIKTEYNPPVPCNTHGALAVSQGRTGTWTTDRNAFCLSGYGEDRTMKILPKDGLFITWKENTQSLMSSNTIA